MFGFFGGEKAPDIKFLEEAEKRRKKADAKRTQEKKEEESKSRELQIEGDHSAIQRLEHEVGRVLDQLKDEIESGAYTAIVGDDASGRIPTLVAAGVIRAVYKERGHNAPLVRFLAGSTGLGRASEEVKEKKRSGLVEQVERIKKDAEGRTNSLARRVLFITDTIDTGETMREFVDAFNKAGWNMDIATLGIFPGRGETDGLKKQLGAKVVDGGAEVPYIKGRYGAAGVQKDISGVFAKRNPDFDGTRVARARKEAKEVVKNILFKKFGISAEADIED
jgi:hypothetical protein